MKKNIFVAATFAVLFTIGCEQKKEASADEITTTEVASTPTNTVNNPNTTNPQEIQPSADAPVMSFKETEFDFGTIKEGEVVNHTFTFTNTGKSPLVIESASSTCGCTIPEFPKEPVAPGAAGKISVQFNSSGKGGTQQLKVITIKANTQPEITQVNIKANVAAAAGQNGPFRTNS
ncbi:DUF1573 domain-containing protein [Adhaeribacter aquaticus]|uniref:DUF1573 domain-containing protein n=1 Tax=Adhaeribacter aquaticus TaxID=299567 RepID=UPI0004102A54|nr:DUF1573 domain-containing protein [Adhaeribacter aquaticus]